MGFPNVPGQGLTGPAKPGSSPLQRLELKGSCPLLLCVGHEVLETSSQVLASRDGAPRAREIYGRSRTLYLVASILHIIPFMRSTLQPGWLMLLIIVI